MRIRHSLFAAMTLAALAVIAGWALVGAQTPTVPAKPTGLSASVTDAGVVLSWDDPGDSSITGYEVLRRNPRVDALGAFTTIVDDTGTASNTYTDAAVVPGESYTYRIKAINAGGRSQRSRFLRAQVPATATERGPTGLAAARTIGVSLSWSAPEAHDYSVTGYRISRATGQADFAVLVDNTASTETSYADATADASTTYRYRVAALRGTELSAWSNTVESAGTVAEAVVETDSEEEDEEEEEVEPLVEVEPESDPEPETATEEPVAAEPVVRLRVAEEVWTTTLTVGDSYGKLGFFPSAGSLPETTLGWQNFELTVTYLYLWQDALYLTASTGNYKNDRAFADFDHAALGERWALRLGETDLLLSEAATGARTHTSNGNVRTWASYTWAGTGLSWSVDDEIAVALLRLEEIPAADLAPTGLSASVADGVVTLSWDAPAEASDEVTAYEITRTLDGASSVETVSGATTHEDASVEAGETYGYQVVALRSGEGGVERSEASNTATVSVPVNPTQLIPTGLTAAWMIADSEVLQVDGVRLSWSAPAALASRITGYSIWRSVDEASFEVLVANTASTSTGYEDASANDASRSYRYRVLALRGTERSLPSEIAGVEALLKVSAELISFDYEFSPLTVGGVCHQCILEATLTAGRKGSAYGFGPGYSGSRLTDKTFEVDETTYTITELTTSSGFLGTSVEIIFDTVPNASQREKLTLRVGNNDFPFDDADTSGLSDDTLFWLFTSLTRWTVGQQVQVAILDTSLPETPPPPPTPEQPNVAATGEPTISDTTPRPGNTLTAGTSDIADANGLDNVSYSYQWYAIEYAASPQHVATYAINNATNSTYTVRQADLGAKLVVEVTFTDDEGYEERLLSERTSYVRGPDNSQVASKSFANLASGNTAPAGLYTDGTTMWVLDRGDDKVYAYNLSTKNRDTSKEFDLASGNNFADFMTSDGKTMWVGQFDEGPPEEYKLYAYSLVDDPSTMDNEIGTRQTDREIEYTMGHVFYQESLHGVAVAGERGRIYVLSEHVIGRRTVADFSSVTSTFQRGGMLSHRLDNMKQSAEPSYVPRAQPEMSLPETLTNGMAIEGDTIWLVDSDSRTLYAFSLSKRAPEWDRWMHLPNNHTVPYAATIHDGTIWVLSLKQTVLDSNNNRVETTLSQNRPYKLAAYNLPQKKSIANDRTKSVLVELSLLGVNSGWAWINVGFDRTLWPEEWTLDHTYIGVPISGNYRHKFSLGYTHTWIGSGGTSYVYGSRSHDPPEDLSFGFRRLEAGATYSLRLKHHIVEQQMPAAERDNHPDHAVYGGLRHAVSYGTGFNSDGTFTTPGTGPLREIIDRTNLGAKLPRSYNGHSYLGYIWIDESNDILYVATNHMNGTTPRFRNKIYAFNLSDLSRNSSKDISLVGSEGGGTTRGIWSDGTTIWVADTQGDDHLYAYNMTGGRDDSKDIDIDNRNPVGIWGSGNTIYVVDRFNDKVFAYNKSNGNRQHGREFDLDVRGGGMGLSGNYQPTGVFGDGTTIWVADSHDSKLYAYRLSNGNRDSGKDFRLHHSNGTPLGIYIDSPSGETHDRLWVIDWSRSELFRYQFPMY